MCTAFRMVLCPSFIAVLMVAVGPEYARSQVNIPRTISHQGLLADATTGDPVPDASHDVTFRLYEASSGGTAVWTEAQSVSTVDGIFNVVLGSITPLDPIQFNKPMWLSIQVDPDPEMIDRAALTSVPYSMGLAMPFADTVSSTGALIQLNNSGSGDGILVTNTGTGTAGAFITEDPAGINTGVYGQSNGLGAAVFGQHFGEGNAGRFVILNSASDSAALYVETDGTGPGMRVNDSRAEINFDSDLGSPQLLLRETSVGDFSRLRMRNDDNGNFWDIAAGFVNNSRFNIYREGTGDIMTLTSAGRVGIRQVNPGEALHVNGVIRTDSLYYNAPLQGYASIHGSAFLPMAQDGTIEYLRNNGGFYFSGGTAVAALAPIQLPHNAVVETLTCRISDATASENLTCQLCREMGTGCLLLGEVTSDDVSGGLDSYSIATTSMTVDNSAHAFYVVAVTEGASNWSSYLSALQIVGVSVGYSVSGAP